MEEFRDIKIKNINGTFDYKDTHGVSRLGVALQLSEKTKEDWKGIFEDEHRSNRYSTWVSAKNHNDRILVRCPLEQLEQHIVYIKQCVENTNEKYRNNLKVKAEAEKKRIEEAEKEFERQMKIKDEVNKKYFNE